MTVAIGEITIVNLNDVHIATTAPVNPSPNQLWLDVSTVPNVMYRWNDLDEDWVQVSVSLEDLDGKADRDDHEGLGHIVSEHSSLLETHNEEILLMVKQEDINELGKTVSEHTTELSAMAEGIDIAITAIDQSLSGIDGELEHVRTNFKFRIDGMGIGQEGSPLNINLSNEQIDFVDSGQRVAYINGKKMYIDSLEVISSLLVGVHKVERADDEVTIIRWAG